MDLFDVVETTCKRKLAFSMQFIGRDGSLMPLTSYDFHGSVTGDVGIMTLPDRSRAVVVITPVGNVVVHEAGRDTKFAHCYAPEVLRGITGRGKVDDELMATIVGLWGRSNLGIMLSAIIQAAIPKEPAIGSGAMLANKHRHG